MLAAGIEPASTALEEQRLDPLGHASIQTTSGIDEIRTRVIQIDNLAPRLSATTPMAAMTRLELVRTELRTQALGRFAFIAASVPTPGVEPGPLANRASVLPVTPSRDYSKNWFRDHASNVESHDSESCVLPVTPSRSLECGDLSPLFPYRKWIPPQSGDKSPHSKGRTTGLEPASTRATISRLILSATFAANGRDGETRTL